MEGLWKSFLVWPVGTFQPQGTQCAEVLRVEVLGDSWHLIRALKTQRFGRFGRRQADTSLLGFSHVCLLQGWAAGWGAS